MAEGDYGPSTYGDRIADLYDTWFGMPDDAEAAVEFLAPLAGEGRALELGIGTGRVALPLAERGIPVDGIDASEAMVAKLRSKPGGDGIPVTMGDFADVGELVDGRYGLVFVVFNTFFALLTQDDQVRCFRGVARHLEESGAFVIRAFVPDVTRFDRGQRVDALHVEPDEVRIDVSRYDAALQRVDATHVVITEGATRMFPVRIRFAYPPELDLMAQLAGLRLRERWAGWDRAPFTSSSVVHVSVYEPGA